MKPYVSKLFNLGYLDHKGGFAIDIGSGDGSDTKTFEDLGYRVEKFDKKDGKDLREYNFQTAKFNFINCNNVLPFIGKKEEIEIALQKMSAALAEEGTLHFTLFGENDEWNSTESTMSFYRFDEANKMIDRLGLKCLLRSSEEYFGKTMDGEKKYWHILRFVCRKLA